MPTCREEDVLWVVPALVCTCTLWSRLHNRNVTWTTAPPAACRRKLLLQSNVLGEASAALFLHSES